MLPTMKGGEYRLRIKNIIIASLMAIIFLTGATVAEAAGSDIDAIHEKALEIIEEHKEYKAVYHNMEPVYVPYFNEDGKLENQDGLGYAVAVSDVDGGKILWTAYLNENLEFVENSKGYAIVRYEYTDDGKPSLAWYFNSSGEQLDTGSGWLHQYLQELRDKDVTVFIVAKDEASSGMTETIVEDMHDLGIQTDLTGKYRYSFYAMVTGDTVIEDLSQDALEYTGSVDGLNVALKSAGYEAGSVASIVIDGVEYAKNWRGLNVVVFDNETNTVIDSFVVDTFQQTMPVHR